MIAVLNAFCDSTGQHSFVLSTLAHQLIIMIFQLVSTYKAQSLRGLKSRQMNSEWYHVIGLIMQNASMNDD